MSDWSYWVKVAETSGWFIAWTFGCVAIVSGIEKMIGLFKGRRA